ncbi:MAG: nicotinamide riboside transporter PnuC [Bacteroidota bacterium]|nr:nicotinamide riboside transporter PnuC [Candidatus Kapabacteria bacterium]MDW8220838.1 nicotinamide riboside transporter PnuC [Bacteroidota bacterium]
MIWIELGGALAGLLSVWLTIQSNIWCWVWGTVSVLLYATVFFHERLYADMGLQFVFLAINIMGLYEWKYGAVHRKPRVIARVSPRVALFVGIVTACCALSLIVLLKTQTDAVLPELDAILTSCSLAALWMQAKKYREHWIVWFVADIAYVVMFMSRMLILTAGLYAIFAGMAIIGYKEWKVQGNT